ncbi:MAG: zeta toxin family protein [Burkholderiaceae bacterium]|jgi:predicted ABC-type ATPase|nr:zeta toxin family protein [Burkholderiaceae bacterium]
MGEVNTAHDDHAPRAVIFAGPNGAGKSTYADAIADALGIRVFVNADCIARELNGIQTDTVAFAAGRIMLRRLKELADARQSFAFELTLPSRSFASFLQRLKQRGYHVVVYYFSLASAPLAVRRVRLRVAQGGHGVPVDISSSAALHAAASTFWRCMRRCPTIG